MSKLASTKNVFIVGLKGQGMTALALVLSGRGAKVSGSDTDEEFSTDIVLKAHHIEVVPFSAAVPNDVDAVVYSTAYVRERHPQLVEAAKRSVPLMSYPEAVGELFLSMEGIAVAGTHGKTTTTAMIGVILAEAGKDPTVIAGSPVADFEGNARVGKSNLLVVEADEYQNKFQYYTPQHLVVTNIEYDHPDFFTTVGSYQQAFLDFALRIPPKGIILLRGDDPSCSALRQRLSRNVLTFGKNKDADVHFISSAWHNDHQRVRYAIHGREYECRIPLPGEHNALNAIAAIALTHQLGVEQTVAHAALAKFSGVARRFDERGTFHGATIIDDFAHHPTEVKAAIAAARQRYPGKKLTVVFQPHTYSRTKALLQNFADVLRADTVLVIEITASARETKKTISSKELVKKIPKSVDAEYVATLEDVAAMLRPRLSSRDIVLLLGAGEIWKVADMLTQE